MYGLKCIGFELASNLGYRVGVEGSRFVGLEVLGPSFRVYSPP